MGHKILVIEDEPGLLFMLKDSLETEGYRIVVAEDGEAGIKAVEEEHPDLILLDVMLPKRNGWEVCRILRNNGIDTPIIMLTVKNHISDKVLGFKLGADDYVTKPFSMMELISRIKARLRRKLPLNQQPELYHFGNVKIDFKHFQAFKNDNLIHLSIREWRILEFFIKNRNKLITRNQLLSAIWGYESVPFTRTVDMHICKIRQKIEDDPKNPKYLITIHWAGYKFYSDEDIK